MLKNMKISVKILLVILIMSLGSLLFIFGASYYFMNDMVEEFEKTNITIGLNSSEISKSALLTQAEDYLYRLVEKQAQAANESFYAVNRIVTQSAQYTHSLYENSSNFIGKKMPRPDETILGVACSKYFLVKGVTETPEIAKEVNILSNGEYMFAPFLANNNMLDNIYIGTESGISYRFSRGNSYNPNYDPRKRDWYTAAMKSPDKLVWLPTYIDSYGHVCITAAMTYRDGSGEIAGVVASDVYLTRIIDDIMKLKVGETGSCFVLDSGLNFIAHPEMDNPEFKSDIREHINDVDFIRMLQNSNGGIAEALYEGNNCYLAFSRLSETGWIFCASIETQEVTEPAITAKAKSDELTESSQQQMQKWLFEIFRLFMIFFAVIGIIVIMLSFTVSGTITRPIQELAASVQGVGEGNFDQKITVKSGDEVGQLAKRFNEMQDNLKNYLEDIKKITTEKERIETELSVATQIQADMLPRDFPVQKEFALYATMNPAKEVGGDFYDFFMIDDDHLALVMADVS
ncbi:MAG: HAMP domain-containing protein, partial [Synergistaceae bacterium]|nr:HAMP domain-containing protein [Synergistaceae bacterium]